MNIYSKLLRKKYMKSILRNIVLVSISVILTISAPIILRKVLVDFENKLKFDNSVIIFFIIFSLAYLVKFIYISVQANFGYKFKVKETKKLYENMFKMKYSDLNSLEPTYLVERINSAINTLYNLLVESLSNSVVAYLTLIVSLVLIFFVDIRLFIIDVFLFIIHYFGYKRLNSNLGLKSQKLQTVCAKNFKNILSITSNVDYIKQEGDHTWINSLLEKNIINVEKEMFSVDKYAKRISLLLEYIIISLQNISYIYIVYLFLINKIIVTDLIYVNLVNSLFFAQLKQIIQINIDLRDVKGAIEFIQNEILYLEEEDGDVEITEIKKIEGNITNLGYDNVLIKNGKFASVPGDITFIKGKSGSGKSTFIKNINKMISNNFIYINEIEISKLKNNMLRRKIALLSQNVLILPISIKENILLGKQVDDVKWKRLIERGFMTKFLELPNGVDTIIQENGSNLSGGDKQKIAIARLFLDNPDVIILDESTNSIDKSTAIEILNELKDSFGEKIIYIISHEEYIQDYCNNIINIEDKVLSQKVLDNNIIE